MTIGRGIRICNMNMIWHNDMVWIRYSLTGMTIYHWYEMIWQCTWSCHATRITGTQVTFLEKLEICWPSATEKIDQYQKYSKVMSLFVLFLFKDFLLVFISIWTFPKMLVSTQNTPIFSRKTRGCWVVGYHHLRKPPYEANICETYLYKGTVALAP